MVSFGSIVKDRATVYVDFEGEELAVTYKPSTLSSAYMSERAEEFDDDDSEGFAKLFCDVVVDWELSGPVKLGNTDVKADEKVPLTPEVVKWIPMPHLRVILAAIGEATPKEKKRKGSSRR